MRRYISIFLFAAVAVLVLSGAASTRVPVKGDGAGTVLAAPLTGTVDPVMLEFVTRTIERAEDDDFDAVLLELDTPGGLSTSMDDIVRRITATELPVLVLVTPTGGRAASAGVFITYAADVAAMSDGTNMGSATPIAGNGQELPKDLRKKVVNDAVAKVRELARLHGRDADFAEDAIRDARNVGAEEALEIGAIEHIASDARDLLERSNGDELQHKGIELRLADARIERIEPPLTLRILKHIIDPNLLFLLFGAGIVGLGFELTHPGSILPGVAGAISLLTALFGLSVLPAQGAGMALLLLAAGLIAAEPIAPGGGLLGAGGAVALLIGSLLLFEDSSGYGISLPLAIGTSLALGALFILIARAGWGARRLAPTTGAEGLIGAEAVVRSGGGDAGGPLQVLVDGELWRARLPEGSTPPARGDRVVVRAVDGLVLDIESKETSP